MAEFLYKYADDETYCVIGYSGDERSVDIPDQYCGRDVTIVSDDLFKGHAELESVSLPANMRTLGGFVFDGCTRLHEVSLPGGITDIWQYAFVRSAVRTIDIPGSLQHIIPYVFKDCAQLETVSCHKGLQKIFANAFSGCSSLREISVPADTEISDGAFSGCPDVKIIRF